MPTADENLQTKQVLCGVSFDNHHLAKIMNDGCTESLMKPQGQRSMITKTSSSVLGGSNGHSRRLKS
jgi:hypothetical protein